MKGRGGAEAVEEGKEARLREIRVVKERDVVGEGPSSSACLLPSLPVDSLWFR